MEDEIKKLKNHIVLQDKRIELIHKFILSSKSENLDDYLDDLYRLYKIGENNSYDEVELDEKYDKITSFYNMSNDSNLKILSFEKCKKLCLEDYKYFNVFVNVYPELLNNYQEYDPIFIYYIDYSKITYDMWKNILKKYPYEVITGKRSNNNYSKFNNTYNFQSLPSKYRNNECKEIAINSIKNDKYNENEIKIFNLNLWS